METTRAGRTARFCPATAAGLSIILVMGLAWPALTTRHDAAPASGARGVAVAPTARPVLRRRIAGTGGAWTRTPLAAWTSALLDDPDHPGVVLAGTSDGVWLSTDEGESWRRDGASLRGIPVLSFGAGTARQSVVAGSGDGAVYMRTGRGWSRISPILGTDHPVFSVAVSPGDGPTVLEGTFGAIYRGRRTRDRWIWRQVAHLGDSAVTALAWPAWQADVVFAGVFAAPRPVLASRDDGVTWHPDSRGLPSTLPTQALLPLSSRPPSIVLSTMGGGVWLRSPSATWHDVSAGLPARHAMPLVATQSGRIQTLYGGTMGFGVYVKRGSAPWRRLGRGLSGGDYTVLALALTSGRHAVLLAGTARGVFRYPLTP